MKAADALHGDGGSQAFGVLDTILMGAVWASDRTHHIQDGGHQGCPYCNSGEQEDAQHLFWRCSTWEAARARFRDELQGDEGEQPWPRCTFGALQGAGELSMCRS